MRKELGGREAGRWKGKARLAMAKESQERDAERCGSLADRRREEEGERRR